MRVGAAERLFSAQGLGLAGFRLKAGMTEERVAATLSLSAPRQPLTTHMAAMMRFPLVCRREDVKISPYPKATSRSGRCAKETMTIIRNALVPELAVSDWQKSRAFYCDLIGFHVVYERPEEGFTYLALGEAQLMIDQIGATRTFVTDNAVLEFPFGRGMNLQLAVPSLQPILSRLERSSIDLVMPMEEKWYRRGTVEVGNRQFIVADPDGYLIRPFESLGERPFRFG